MIYTEIAGNKILITVKRVSERGREKGRERLIISHA